MSIEFKTVKDWLTTIPNDEVRSMALKNLKDHAYSRFTAKEYVPSLTQAIIKFDWGKTNEGYQYWLDMARSAQQAL